jgi:tRNA (guanine37-N1)-methyltransferase
MFPGLLGDSITGRALAAGLVRLNAVDIRDFATDKHRSTDDYPYGGGPGMVMRPAPLVEAIESVRRPSSRLLLLTPGGRRFTQAVAHELAREEHMILVCGRYEGMDERVSLLTAAEELSVGDFVLTGGELAAMVVLDAVMRLLPGVLSTSDAWRDESHSLEGLLEYPQYTRPVEFRGLRVPDVLLSGHHAQVAAWRRREALLRTLERRPDMLTTDHLRELRRLDARISDEGHVDESTLDPGSERGDAGPP